MTRLSKKSKRLVRPQVPIKGKQPCIEGPDFSKVPSVPYIFGYVRVSRDDQNPEMQITMMKEAGAQRIFMDKLSGRTDRRPEFKLMLKHLQPHDTLLIYSFSRLFRNTEMMLALFRRFNDEKITLRCLTQPLDIRTSHGRLHAKFLAAVDEHEVEQLAERTKHGMAELKRQGRKFGAPPKVSPEDAKKMAHMRFKTRIPVPAIASRYHVSDAAVYQHTKPYAANYS